MVGVVSLELIVGSTDRARAPILSASGSQSFAYRNNLAYLHTINKPRKKRLNVGMLRFTHDLSRRTENKVFVDQLAEEQSIDHSAPDGYSLTQGIRHAFTSSCGIDYDASVARISLFARAGYSQIIGRDPYPPTRFSNYF